MKPCAVIGTYFDNLKDAERHAKHRRKLLLREFVIARSGEGYIVMSGKAFKKATSR